MLRLFKNNKANKEKKNLIPRYITFLILSIILGGIFTALTSYAATIAATNISYSNTTSGLTATNAQSAIDEIVRGLITITLGQNVPVGTEIIVSGYTYETFTGAGGTVFAGKTITYGATDAPSDVTNAVACAYYLTSSTRYRCSVYGGSVGVRPEESTNKWIDSFEVNSQGTEVLGYYRSSSGGNKQMTVGRISGGKCKIDSFDLCCIKGIKDRYVFKFENKLYLN